MRALSASIDSCSESDSHTTTSPEPMPLHTVVFKCIGCTRDQQSQQILQEVSQKLENDEEVLVNLYPEPDNKFDNKAIAFKCFIRGEWHRIGYVVKEALADVYTALEKSYYCCAICLGQIYNNLDTIWTRILRWNQDHKEREVVKGSVSECQHSIIDEVFSNPLYTCFQ